MSSPIVSQRKMFTANSRRPHALWGKSRSVFTWPHPHTVRPTNAALADQPSTEDSSAVPPVTVTSKGPVASLSVKDVNKKFTAFKRDARAFADDKQFQPLIPKIRMYGELCECTYDNYLAVRKDGTTPIPATTNLLSDKQPGLSPPAQIWKAATGTQADIDKYVPLRIPGLPEELFLAPFPYATSPTSADIDKLPSVPSQLPYTVAELNKSAGFLVPDSPILDAGFEVCKFLYASSGIFDTGDGPDELYWIGYVAYSVKLKEIVLVFRGTQHPSEWQQNADLKAISIVDKIHELKKEKPVSGSVKDILMHQGFCEMYYTGFKNIPEAFSNLFSRAAGKNQALEKQVKAGLLQALDRIREEGEDDSRPFTLTLTGHSLGGALATVAAYDIAHDYEIAAAWPGGVDGLRSSIQGVTWAQPRVGNDKFVADFQSKIPKEKWLRILNDGDIVPMLPFHTLPILREFADSVFEALRITRNGIDLSEEQKETLQEKAKVALGAVDIVHDTADLVRGANRDTIKLLNGTLAKTCGFVHVGWELKFDPDDKKFHYIKTTGHTRSKVKDFFLEGLTAAVESVTPLEVPSLTDASTRHNLEVLMHMLDPSMDKVRLNKSDDNLILAELEEDDLKRLGNRYCWWGPFENSSIRLIKQADGSFKWSYVSKSIGVNGKSAGVNGNGTQ